MPTYDVFKFEQVQVGVVVCIPENLVVELVKKRYFPPTAALYTLWHLDKDTGNGMLYDFSSGLHMPILMVNKIDNESRASYAVRRFDRIGLGRVTCEPKDQVVVLRDAGYLQVPFHGDRAHLSGDYSDGNYLLCDGSTHPETPLIYLQLKDMVP
jgi:hypothetical protein